MPFFNPVLASFNFTHAPSFKDGLADFIAERNVLWHLITSYWAIFMAWLAQPHIYAVIIAWAITFTVVIMVILSLGFGPAGVVVASLAAGFQGWMYGGFTPAAGLFATLTSMGMLGLLMPAAVVGSAVVATLVATAVWACGAGR